MYDASKHWLYYTIFNTDKPINQKEIKERLNQDLTYNLPNLISEESFYCKMFDKKETRFILLNRINQIFPEAKIILGIRNKKSLLISWYKQYIAVGGVLHFDDFIKEIMNLNNLHYEAYIKRLEELYGKKNVYIYKFEDLIKNQEKAIKDLYNFIGCKVPNYNATRRNVGYGLKEIKASLFLNRIYKTAVHKKGINYPYKHIFLPHRLVFQSKLYRPFLKEKVELKDLIKKDETKKVLEAII